MNVLNNLGSIWATFSSTFNGIYTFMSQKLKDVLASDIPVISDVLTFIVDVLKIGDVTIISLMLGTGVTVVIVYTIVKWVVGVLK